MTPSLGAVAWWHLVAFWKAWACLEPGQRTPVCVTSVCVTPVCVTCIPQGASSPFPRLLPGAGGRCLGPFPSGKRCRPAPSPQPRSRPGPGPGGGSGPRRAFPSPRAEPPGPAGPGPAVPAGGRGREGAVRGPWRRLPPAPSRPVPPRPAAGRARRWPYWSHSAAATRGGHSRHSPGHGRHRAGALLE